MENKLTDLLQIQYPIIQGGMIWNASWRLASAVSNAGGLGIIGAGSMRPEVLKENIEKCRAATDKSFAVNVPLLYPQIEDILKIILDAGVKIVFSSAGNPMTWTGHLKSAGITVVHVVSSSKFAIKSEAAGVDAVVAEGFEAGGHNGADETTTMCLVPLVKKAVGIPVIAAGGIGTGASMLAAMALGADGVQIGSRFAASIESSGHANFKASVVEAKEGSTKLTMKKVIPVRLLKNEFYRAVQASEDAGASQQELMDLLGKGRAKKGMFEGNLEEGELEIGQISAQIDQIKPVSDIVSDIVEEFNRLSGELSSIRL
ncbi:MAG: nitronate monooxygenase [Flavobacteriales bacterium]|nr:nitronate monooxygenase [Flavobacteriales bacterium]